MEGVGMLVVSLMGCKFRILVSLRVFQAKRHHMQQSRFRLGLHAKKYKNIYLMCIFFIRFIYSIHITQVFSFACVLTWSLQGVKKSLGLAQIGLLQGLNSKFLTSIPTPFICGVPPPGGISSCLNLLSLNVLINTTSLHLYLS